MKSKGRLVMGNDSVLTGKYHPFGIMAFSAGRVLSNDLAGRGFPGLNIYTGLAAVVTNVVLNLLWIPRYEVVGATWASTVSYTASFFGALFFYCRPSGNRWTIVVFFRSEAIGRYTFE